MQCIDQRVQKQAHHFTYFSVKCTQAKNVIIWHSHTPKNTIYFVHTTTLHTAMIYSLILATDRAVGTGRQREGCPFEVLVRGGRF